MFHLIHIESLIIRQFVLFIFIFRKYEEIYPPDVNEFVYITDNTYSKKQVLRMEQLILKVLSFDLASPTPIMFINIVDVPDKVKHLAMVCDQNINFSYFKAII